MANNRLAGKSIVLVVPPTQFREEEVFEPKRILEKEGARVLIASTSARTCRGMRDGVIESGSAIGDVDPSAHDAVILAGGSSVPEFFWTNKPLLDLVGRMSEAGKVVAAISLSTVVLARAKLLEGRRATVYYLPEAIEELAKSGASYVDEKLVVDRNLIMGEGPAVVDSFTETIVQALAG